MPAGMAMGAPAKPDLNDVTYDAFLANDRTLGDPDVVKVEAGGRYAFGFGDERRRHAQPPRLRRDHRLVDIERARIDGDEAEHFSVCFRNRDRCRRDDFLAPTLAPPVDPLVEIDVGIGDLPSAPPQFDRRGLVGPRITAKREAGTDHCVRRDAFAHLRHARDLIAP